MGKRAGITRRTASFIIAASLIIFILLGVANITYAFQGQGKPDVIVQIDTNGSINQSGDMYDGAKWYPGYRKSGVVRVVNNFRRINIKDLGFDVNIENFDKHSSVYISFINNMRLTISRGKLMVFDDILVKDKSLSQLIPASKNTYSGLQLDDGRELYIEKGASMDLRYDLYMDPGSGNELENLRVNLDFHIIMDELTELSEDISADEKDE